jgi:hypothetical protein
LPKLILMKNIFIYILFSSFFLSCKTTVQTQLNFLDEYVIADSTSFQNSVIGGLSGIDYANKRYYFVVDDYRNPRFLTASIDLQEGQIKGVNFKKVLFLKDSSQVFYQENVLDLESIFVDEETFDIHFVSEGAIKYDKNPVVFTTDSLGRFKESYQIPENFKANSTSKPKHNASFEGSSKSINNKGFWVAMEGVLQSDGEDPAFAKTQSPIRITYFDKKTKKPAKQFAYQLANITKPARGNVNLNGVTAILEYKENHFFIIERAYQNGYGAYGNVIRIFEAIIASETTNTLKINSLKETDFIPLKKRLVFNFEDIKNQLTAGIIDNIEGITFGPKLANGNQSLLLISDDNFQLYGKQLNQLILLEIK